jgi:hypothetical protein
MTVGKISALCWTGFMVMSLGFLPLAVGIMDIHAIPTTPRIAMMLVVVILAWWGPFAWEAPRGYKYRLRVTLDVAVSRHNHKRVTIDVGQGDTRGEAQPPDSRMPGMSGMRSW